ncbi:MAG: ABC transporter ATP-binding protein [Candidatus Berkelbacteria bacterium]|nr:ABC transporter ATP-binding protein [Candidatus Berkelbacteria bacterium]
MSEEKRPTPPAGGSPQIPGHARGAMPGGGMARGAFGLVEKPKNFSKTMKDLVFYMRPFWTKIIFVFIFAIASTVFAIIGPRILGNMTNQVVSDYTRMVAYDQVVSKLPKGTSPPPGTTIGDVIAKLPASATPKITADKLNAIKFISLNSRPSIDFANIKRLAIILIGLYLLSAILSYIQGWIMSFVSQRITYNFRRDISEKINKMPLKYFDSRTHGEVLSRVTNDVDTVSQTLNQSLTQIVTSVTMILGILVMMLTISWLMTLVAVVVLPLGFIIIGMILKKSQVQFKRQQDYLGHINGHVEEMYSGHTVMRVFNGEKKSISKFQQINNILFNSAWRAQFLSGLMFPLVNFIGNLNYVGVAVLGGYLAVKGRLQIGDIQAFIQYVQQFNQPIVQTANIANVMQSTAAAAERVFEFLSEPDEVPDTDKPVVIEKPTGAVEFDNVIFGYDPEKVIIKGFSAKVKAGSRIAIVGPTGAGKTTIVNLLMRFYDVNKGSIKIDGVDTKKMKRQDVRKMFGMVLQDTWLFNGTIRDNIGYGKPDATKDEIVAAAQAAHADHFIHALPKGYDMELNEEADNVSAGEKQLLTIARAMLVKTPMLILDEATSSVDTRTEQLIQKAMKNLMKNKTSFVIAHRLSTIRDADLILVMNEGNIVEQGTHDELLKKKGFYASLYDSQFTSAAVE